jgi:trigger factor
MQYAVTKGEKGKVEIKVDVSKAQFEEAFNQVLSQLSKDAKIAGFRPGKAPADVVERHIGLGKILNETASSLISKHLAEIFKKKKLVPLDSPNVAVGSLGRDLPFSFTSTFTPKPKINVGVWKKIKVKKVKAREITQKDIADSIKNIFDAWEKQQEQKGSKGPKEPNEPEETKKFIYDAHGEKIFLKDEESKSKVVAYKIDDEFAKAIGARDLSHLQEIVKKDLETLVADQVEAKFEQEIFDEIGKISTVDIGEILVDDELNRILVRFNSQLAQQKKSLEEYLSEQKTTIDELKAKWRPQAEKNVKISLTIDQIGKDEKVQVQKEEVDKALASVNQTNLSDEQKRDLQKYLAFSIFQAKTLDLIKKIVAT